MQQVPKQSWDEMEQMQELRYPGKLSVNMHWLKMMSVSEGLKIDRHGYADALQQTLGIAQTS